ncbi:PDDEXK nuclease domain-containing protein [Phytoactinopolyspora halotolerans]|uniref:DUF1016 domain-containing protein n=1 Tax=Phytoactinopolyspora halotolerans TaxID=1981512 RepID=A0A6L9SCB3_9ACTN|nr:PDDEXK nuclease domain-containing protein [Phytoactinopolyspora halotolerans]NEE03015.1 DUF1016 domain-containing protein [Phytoactinopolyspora halotolerans]
MSISQLNETTGSGGLPAGYGDLLDEIKQEIKGARLRTALAVNAEMVALYWRIGRLILDRQQDEGWGAKVVARLAADIRVEYPQVKGFSRTNLGYMRAFARAWPAIVPQLGGKLPWGHIKVLLDQLDGRSVREFYGERAAEEGWSRSVLVHQIKSRLHERVGVAPNTFERTVPLEERESVQRLVRDPYMLEFLEGDEGLKERDLEGRLLIHVARFLQELGVGFAFMGSQYCLLVGGEEFFVDLLFYHMGMRRFIVIELKVGKFKPEHAGKLAFYVNVIDRQLRKPEYDAPTLGILLVASRNDVVVEYALDTVDSPVAVSTWSALPADVREQLPSAEQLAVTISSAFDDKDEATDG